MTDLKGSGRLGGSVSQNQAPSNNPTFCDQVKNCNYIKQLDQRIETLEQNPASGDMQKSVYDTDNDGKVDQAHAADLLNGYDGSEFIQRDTAETLESLKANGANGAGYLGMKKQSSGTPTSQALFAKIWIDAYGYFNFKYHNGYKWSIDHSLLSQDRSVQIPDEDCILASQNYVAGEVAAGVASKQDTSEKNQNNGYAGLDSNGLIPPTILPSYVDDVLEYANVAAFPVTGESEKVYVALDTFKIYRWSGSIYVEISPSPGTTDDVTEGTVNKYFTTSRVLATLLAGIAFLDATLVTAADSVLIAIGKLQKQISDNLTTLTNHTSNSSNPHGVTKAQVGLSSVDNTSDADKPVSTAQSTALGLKADKAGDTFTGLIQFSGTGHAGLQVNSLTTAQRTALTPVNGMIVYDSDLGAICRYAAGHWEYEIDARVSGSNATTTSNAAGNVTGLAMPLEANSVYRYDGYAQISCSSTGGVKWALTVPAATTFDAFWDGVAGGITSAVRIRSTASGSLTGTALNTAAINSGIHFKGYIYTGANAGTAQVQFASGTNGQTSTVYIGSFVSLKKIG